jgi:hypothetical protein
VPSDHDTDKSPWAYVGKAAQWIVGTLIAAAVAAYLTGDLPNFVAKKTQPDNVRLVVVDYLAAVRRGDRNAANRLTGDAKRQQWRAWDPEADPVVWMSPVSITALVKTAESARAYAKPSAWGFRRAEAGCRSLDEAFHLVKREGQWLIDELPRLGAVCSERLVAESWRSYEPKGVQRWARKDLQRVDVVHAQASASIVSEGADKTVDLGRKSLLAPKVSTAFQTHRDKPNEWQDARLSFVFEKPVVLVRMRFHNGIKSGYRRHGRIRRAVITAGEHSVEVRFPDRNAWFRLDCDFGNVGRVAIQITDIYPAQTPPVNRAPGVAPLNWTSVDAAQSDVALSHVDFWARVTDDEYAEPTGPYAFATHPNQPRDKEVVATCGRRPIPPEAPPAPATSQATTPTASASAPQPGGPAPSQPGTSTTQPSPQAPSATSTPAPEPSGSPPAQPASPRGASTAPPP